MSWLKILCLQVVWQLTYNLQIPDLTDHGISVHLAHVVTSILLLHAAYMQQPRFSIVVRHTKSGYSWDHVAVYRQDHLPVYVYPSDLKTTTHKILPSTGWKLNEEDVWSSREIWKHAGCRLRDWIDGAHRGSLCNNAEKWLETSSSTTETWILLAPDCYLKHLARVCGILN